MFRVEPSKKIVTNNLSKKVPSEYDGSIDNLPWVLVGVRAPV